MNINAPDGFFPGGNARVERYTNPFFGVPFTFLPLNLDQMIWWADHFLLRFGFYRAALFRIANYFITELNIECDDDKAKEQYQEIFESLCWKEKTAMHGLNLLAYGNAYATVCQGFHRFLICPQCQKIYSIDRILEYEFSPEGKFSMQCKRCKYKGKMEAIDKPSRATEDINVIFWNPREVKLRYEETTGFSEYFWDYPPAYAQKITRANNKFFSKHTPQAIYDAVIAKKLLAFNPTNFHHAKLPTPAALHTDGRAVPPCIYMFDDFFMLQVLRRFNEVICFEEINPFRVFSMAEGGNPQANPILHQNSKIWQSAIDEMIHEHRLDPGSYHKFPFALNYQQLGGQGKNLAPIEIIDNAIRNILNALNIPQELYTMNFQHRNSVGPALRLFENSWSCLVDSYNRFLNYVGTVVGKIKNLPEAKIGVIPVNISDDMERKSVVSQLVSANAIAKSEMLKLYGFDYKEQVRKRMEEERDTQDVQREEQAKAQLSAQSQQAAGTGGGGGTTPQDILEQAAQMAQDLFPKGPAERRQALQQLKAQDAQLYAAVKQALEEMTSQSRSQGVAQAQQNAQQAGPA